MTWRRTWAVARKEFLHIRRDPRSLLLALAVPVVLLLLFGYALRLDVDRIPMLVRDADNSPQSRELIARFAGSRFFEVIEAVEDEASIARAMERGRCLMALVIPPEYSRRWLRGERATIQVLVDGSDSNTAAIALGYAETVLRAHAREWQIAVLRRAMGRRAEPPLELRLRIWYNSELRSRNYIVPGLIAIILMIIAALLTSLTIAREWELGTMESLLSTPVRAAEIVLGKMLAFFAIGLLDLLIVLGVGVVFFRVPLRGDPLLVLLTGGLFLFGALGWGVFISALVRSQVLAYQLGVITSFLPAFLLSGFIFAIENMPPVVRALTYLVPARYFIVIMRGLFLKGIGLETLLAEVLFLIGYAGVVCGLATRRVRRGLM
jgi:ABC-2 type transport system permease protein